MIKLEADKMNKAIERAKVAHPKVRVVSAADRVYAVTGRHGDSYTVRFVVANGHKLASCDCPARGVCYHIAAAASVNIAVQSMRRQVAGKSNVLVSRQSNWYGQRTGNAMIVNGWAV